MKVKREQRLNSEFQREIYDILKNKVKDPEISEMFSILEVDTTNDLKYAKVYVSVFSTDEGKREATFAAISRAAKQVRGELSRTMHIRTVPELTFILDNSSVYGQKIDEILSKITYSAEPGEEGEDK